ncbi:MAG: Gfo/Idh/MocA family oxidoreductase, partial [Chlorobi bacterium]|nr:Gfo/Idh/MocA family oxidoreductase [Chlorobiota bacterium]
MSTKIKWGILSTAYIGTDHVIPAMLNSKYCDVHAISSRGYDKAKDAAEKLNIPKYYGSYEELLQDGEIEAVYIPLPNHLHVPWAIKALEAGKHVLVEKPVGLSSLEAEKLLEESRRHPNLKIMEAFMYRHHPQWIKVKELIESGAIGKVKTIQSFFSFFDDNPGSIVNKKEYGGGSLMDIGCYPISLSRFIYNSEPETVFGSIEYHPEFGIDTAATAIMKFKEATSAFFSSIRLEDRQQAQIYGTEGKIEFQIPFNPIANKPSKIFLHKNNKTEEIIFEPCDQYTIQADLFALAVINNTDVPTPLQDAVDNMKVIEAIIESDK